MPPPTMTTVCMPPRLSISAHVFVPLARPLRRYALGRGLALSYFEKQAERFSPWTRPAGESAGAPMIAKHCEVKTFNGLFDGIVMHVAEHAGVEAAIGLSGVFVRDEERRSFEAQMHAVVVGLFHPQHK